MIEILTLKLAIDLFDHLRTYKMELSYVQIYIWKKTTNKFQYFSFNSYDQLWDFYYNRYAPFDLCEQFGDIWAVNKFTVRSQLDSSYTMTIDAYDVSGNGRVRETSQFDNDRNNVWSVTKERQIELVQSIVNEYEVYYSELYEIYLHGVYSVCYAEPGWTTHTTRLRSYRDLLFPQDNQQTSKYSGFQID